MTVEQYDNFRVVIEEKGYQQRNAKGTIQSEDWYFYKGFAYPDKEDAQAGYQIIFLVYDRRFAVQRAELPKGYTMGVVPLILTDNHEWSRIDLTITEQNFDVDKVEEFAHDFYYKFLLTHGL